MKIMNRLLVISCFVVGFSADLFSRFDPFGSSQVDPSKAPEFYGDINVAARARAAEQAALRRQSQWTPLQTAINNCKFDGVKRLVEGDDTIDINEPAKYGNTPLVHAISLLTAGDNLRDKKNDHTTMYQIIYYLLDHGAQPDVVKDGNIIENLEGRTALNLAVVRGNQELIERLLQFGANVNYVNSKNQTALNYFMDEKRNLALPFLGIGLDEDRARAENKVDARERYLMNQGARRAPEPILYSLNRAADNLLDYLMLGEDTFAARTAREEASSERARNLLDAFA
ncbi:MAG: ankyrin repeat domain-containing protein [Candidatus Chromulinivorax sp.]|nr:ankyrin repeat domain-containing protein [Candidatus Chromulinivorax sp.]